MTALYVRTIARWAVNGIAGGGGRHGMEERSRQLGGKQGKVSLSRPAWLAIKTAALDLRLCKPKSNEGQKVEQGLQYHCKRRICAVSS